MKKPIRSGKTPSTTKSKKPSKTPSTAKERTPAKANSRKSLKEQEYLDIVEAMVIVVGKNQTVLEINKKGCEVLGFPRKEILGKNWFQNFIPKKLRKNIQNVFLQLMAGKIKSVEYFENPVLTKAGEERIIHWHNSYLIEEGEIVGVLSSGSDITDRIRAEENLRESEQKLSTLVSNLSGMIYRCRNDKNWTMEYLSEGCTALTGYKPQDLIQNHQLSFGQDVIHPEDKENVWEKIQFSLKNSEPFQITYRIRTFSGEEKWVWEQGRAITASNGDLEMLEGFITDITAQKRAEQNFEKSREELRNLSRRLQTIREEEKKNIAREIHDEMGQFLTAMKMDLITLEDDLTEDQKSLREKTQVMAGLVDSTLNSIQRICMELRPQVLDVLGLSEAIEWQGKEYERNTGTKVDLIMPRKKLNLDQDRSITCFRILQESLTNVTRHAEATHVKIKVENKKNHLVLKIEDNGKGINDEQLSDPTSLGLIGMRERTIAFGGNVTIVGCPGKGTTLTAEIPHK